jgi:hypothetical protein
MQPESLRQQYQGQNKPENIIFNTIPGPSHTKDSAMSLGYTFINSQEMLIKLNVWTAFLGIRFPEEMHKQMSTPDNIPLCCLDLMGHYLLSNKVIIDK